MSQPLFIWVCSPWTVTIWGMDACSFLTRTPTQDHGWASSGQRLCHTATPHCPGGLSIHISFLKIKPYLESRNMCITSIKVKKKMNTFQIFQLNGGGARSLAERCHLAGFLPVTSPSSAPSSSQPFHHGTLTPEHCLDPWDTSHSLRNGPSSFCSDV